MSLKKFNAVCALILTALLIIHITISLVFMLTGLYNLNLTLIAARALSLTCIVHIIVSLTVLFIIRDRADKSKYGSQKAKTYPALNMRIMIQRVTGLALLVMIHFHIATFQSFIYDFKPLTFGGKAFAFFIEALFFGIVLLHLAVSFSRAFISLGLIRSEETEKRLDRGAFFTCGALFVIIIISLAVFLMKWPAA